MAHAQQLQQRLEAAGLRVDDETQRALLAVFGDTPLSEVLRPCRSCWRDVVGCGYDVMRCRSYCVLVGAACVMSWAAGMM